jgi:hypothetical protein
MAMASSVPSMLDGALWWAKHGMPVLPCFEVTDNKCACRNADCQSPGKHPRLPQWQILATTEEKQIREWWQRWPTANVAVCTGRELPGGGVLTILDEDPRNDGDSTLAALEHQYGPLPETARVITGGQGHHFFFRTKAPLKSKGGELGFGLDIKSERGYVIAWPSVHASGRRYERDAGADLDETDIAWAPDWMTTLASKPEPSIKPASHEAAPNFFIEGGRNNEMASIAGTLRRRGLTWNEMLPTLNAVNASRCRPPLSDDELKKVAVSIGKMVAADPLGKDGNDPWRLMTTAQIFEPLGPYPWLIEGIQLAPGRPTLLSSLPDVGKTVISMSIALAVATGRPLWALFRAARSGKALHLNGEIGSYIARERYQRLARGMGADVEELISSGRLVLSNYPTARLDDVDFEEKLSAIVDGFELVVIDSLRAFSGALDEKSKELGVAMFKLARVSDRTGATFLVLHHNRKPSRDDVGSAAMSISGTTAILGASECVFVMSPTEKGGPVLVEHERSPTGRRLNDFGLVIEDIQRDGDPRWGMRVVHLEREQLDAYAKAAEESRERIGNLKAVQAIIKVLERYAGTWRSSREALRAEVAMSKPLFTQALNGMIRDRIIREGGSYHKPEFYLSSMTQDVNPDHPVPD